MIDQTLKDTIKESGITLIGWLNAPCLPEDLLPLPWDLNISYLPIEKVRLKFSIMEEVFGATVEQVDVSTNAINTFDKDTLIWSCVKFIVYHPDFLNGRKMFVGTASFLKGQYGQGWAYSQIGESLATVRAFSKEYAQFGKDLNKDIDSIKDLKSPKGSKENSVSKTMQTVK